MADTLHWVGEPVTDCGVAERRFNLVRDTGLVPGVLWLPAGPYPYPKPLVLLGHGGSGHKRAARQLGLGRWFASKWDIASVAIDGPFHGDRQRQDRPAAIGVDAVTDGMVDDWTATLDALIDLNLIDSGRVAYLGLSMGTRFGLPYVAAANRRLCCAVLGKYGLLQSPVVSAPADAAERVARDAPNQSSRGDEDLVRIRHRAPGTRRDQLAPAGVGSGGGLGGTAADDEPGCEEEG
ncbi:alpha/beta hydrolase family protein [Kribbella sp. NPDC051587]|uniref:alpha/beta hydrolase family protein n=1 Tax=Kribbella sp. NPDC051587 TaxID=3364119 RepID=UPI00379794BA